MRFAVQCLCQKQSKTVIIKDKIEKPSLEEEKVLIIGIKMSQKNSPHEQ